MKTEVEGNYGPRPACDAAATGSQESAWKDLLSALRGSTAL